MDTGSILDLRFALEFLASIPGQLATTRQPVDAIRPHFRAFVANWLWTNRRE